MTQTPQTDTSRRPRRVLLKLSGEVFGGGSVGLDADVVSDAARQIAQAVLQGVQVAVVVGGGNFFRGAELSSRGMDRARADYMGMLGTVMNALALQDFIEQAGVPAPVVTDPAVSVDAPGPASPPVPAGPGAPDLGTSASSPVPAGPALAGTASQETSAPATLTVPPDPASRTEPASPPVPAGPTETTGPTELASPSRPTGPEPPPVPGSTPVTGTTAGAHPTVLTHGQTAPVAGLTVSDATWLVPDAAGVSVPGSGQGDPAPLPQRSPRVRYTWPTGGPVAVLASFDPPAHDWLRGHRGVDLALAAGSPVRAAAAGTVAFSGPVAGRPVVSIDHADGIRTTYEPVEPCVQAGDHVEAGQVIGTLLAGHRTDGVDALHWGARTGRKSYINPLRLLTSTVIRLKPTR